MAGFREIVEVKPHEKNLFKKNPNQTNKASAIKTVERDSLGRITKIVLDTDNPNAFNFESPNEVFEVASTK